MFAWITWKTGALSHVTDTPVCSCPFSRTGQYRVPPGGFHQPGVEFKGQAFQGQGQFQQQQGQGRPIPGSQFNPPVPGQFQQGQGQFQGQQQQFQQGQGQYNHGQGQFQGQQQFQQGQFKQGQGQMNQGQGQFRGPQFEEKDGLKFQGNDVKFQTPDPKLTGHQNVKGQLQGHGEGQGQGGEAHAVKGDGSTQKETNKIKLPEGDEDKLPKY